MSRASNPLSAILDLPGRISRLVPRSDHGLTVLSVDGRWLKVLQMTGRGAVSALIAHKIEGETEEAVIDWLKAAWSAASLEPRPVLIANPSHLTTTRLFTLPSVDPTEIRDIIALQAEKHTPYTKEEILTDFQILETDRSGYSRVLLVLSHQDIVHRALRLVEGMGWVLERVGFELEGLVNWVQLAKPDVPEGLTLVAELDSETTTLVAVKGEQSYFHRSIALGSQHLTQDPAEAPAKLLGEFQRSLESFDSEGSGQAITGIALTGHAERFPELKEKFHKGLDLPVAIAPSFAQVELPESVAAGPARESVSFASLLGLAMRPSRVDLTPKALKLHRAFEARAKALVGLACQGIGCLLLVSCLVIGTSMKDERYHAWLHHEERSLSAQVAGMESTMDQASVVQDWAKTRSELLNAVKAMAQRTPEAIQWETLVYTRGEQIALKGISDEIPKVYDFATELRSAGAFAQVEAKRVNKRKVNDKDVTEFELVCAFKPPETSNGDEKSPHR